MSDQKRTTNPLFPEGRPGFLDRFRSEIGPGRVIRGSGRYEILRLLGAGGMGRVYLAEKAGAFGFTKLMAIKVLPKNKVRYESDRAMFLDEARLCGGLNHPNIVQVYQLGETRREFFIIMEHVFGVTVLDLIERLQELDQNVAIKYGVYIITRVLSGLHYAHRRHNRDGQHMGIIHRDICPSNILISFRGIPKLTDFGVAKSKLNEFDDEKVVVFGKYPYMAPEQVRREGTEVRSDIYSMGLVMYELFTHQLAHEVGDTKMLLNDLKNKRVIPPMEVDSNVPADLSKIIMKAVSIDKHERYRSAKAMRLALETFLMRHFMFPEQDDFADYLCDLFPQAAKHRWW